MDLELNWQGQNWSLLPDRALFWKERETLILSDLHLGKAQDFQAAGIPVPSTIHYEDLSRLAELLSQHQPKRVFILGDLIHSNRNEHQELRAAFRKLHGNAKWILALGNHDLRAQKKLQAWGFDEIINDILEAGIIFCHDESSCDGPSINGHVHPVIKVGNARDRLRLPCFVVGQKRMLLPSFGAFTGGFEITPRAKEKIFALTGDAVFEIPL